MMEKVNMPPNNKYTEIHFLHEMLSNENIPHTMKRFKDGWQVCYPEENFPGRIMDAIQYLGSYGHQLNLLEIMGLLTPEEEKCDSVVGNLTAIDVFLRIKNHWLYGTDWLKHYYSGE